MTDPVPYVMFGQSRVLGNLVQLIGLCGGALTKIVENVPEEPWPGSPDVTTRLARFRDPGWNPYGVNHGLEVVREPIEDFEPRAGEMYIVGFTGRKMEPLVQLVAERHGVEFQRLVHPSAVVTQTARLGTGCTVMAGVVLESGVTVGRHAYVNLAAVAGHDVTIGDYCVVGPRVAIGGNAVIAAGAHLGMGACILEDRRVGEGAVVAAGAVVRDDVPPGALVAGVPAVVKRSKA